MVLEELDSRGGGGHAVLGGHTEGGVLTIPWVISQLSMGSSRSAGLSSPFTLSWINNRTIPYTREDRRQAHSIQCRERDGREVKYARGGWIFFFKQKMKIMKIKRNGIVFIPQRWKPEIRKKDLNGRYNNLCVVCVLSVIYVNMYSMSGSVQIQVIFHITCGNWANIKQCVFRQVKSKVSSDTCDLVVWVPV